MQGVITPFDRLEGFQRHVESGDADAQGGTLRTLTLKDPERDIAFVSSCPACLACLTKWY